MRSWVWLLFTTVLTPSLVNGSFKVCTTSDLQPECTRLEASRDEVRCVHVEDSVDCIHKFWNKEVDLGLFDPEEALLASQFLGSDVDVVAEIRPEERPDSAFAFQTVVVVKASHEGGLEGLVGARYCNPGFDRTQLWTDRVFKYFEWKVLENQQVKYPCNSDDRNAHEDEVNRLSKIFRNSCRPGRWAISDYWDSKLKKEYPSLCALCEHSNTCSYELTGSTDRMGALRCLAEGTGSVAYTTLQYVEEYFNLKDGSRSANASDFRFLCEDGTTRTLAASDPCAWLKQPLPSVIALRNVSSNVTNYLNDWFGQPASGSNKWTEHLKKILAREYGNLKPLPGVVPLSTYIKRGKNLFSKTKCQSDIRWCTTSAIQRKKCDYIRAAAATHGIPGEVVCLEPVNQTECLKKIRDNQADITVIDTEHGFVARKVYNLTTAVSLENDRKSNYYGVAVVKKGSKITSFKDLQGKRACFPQYNGLGWLSFVQHAKKQNLVPSKLCSDTRSVWSFFSEVCAPGAKLPDINPQYDKTPNNMCGVCPDSCLKTPANVTEGEIDALKCVELGAGDVAVVNYYTARHYLESEQDDHRDEYRSKMEDFSILCVDDTVRDFDISEIDACSLSQLNQAEIVTRLNMSKSLRRDIQMTIQDIDDLFGTRFLHPVLRIYAQFDGQHNVLFKNSTIRVVTPGDKENRFIVNYRELQKNMDQCYKDNGVAELSSSLFIVCVSIILLLWKEDVTV